MRDKKENLTGKRFGRLTILRFDSIRKGKTFWWCRCDCGNESVFRVDPLKSGNTRSCGCLLAEECSKFEDLTDQKFHSLRVLKISKHRGPANEIMWICRCECGSKVTVRGNSLRSGHARSCGCLQRKSASKQAHSMGKANKKHGMTFTREFECWHHLKQRCKGTSGKNGDRYAGRIEVCQRWLESFENFIADMGMRPSNKHQIDRIDNDGDYCPENCRWVLPKEQQRNRSSNKNIEYKGKTQCIAAWAEEYGLTTLQLWRRLKSGWLMEEALLTKVDFRNGAKRRKKSITA